MQIHKKRWAGKLIYLKFMKYLFFRAFFPPLKKIYVFQSRHI